MYLHMISRIFLFSKLMGMSLQSKPLVGKGISSLKPRLRLGFRGRNFFADLGLGLQRYISYNICKHKIISRNSFVQAWLVKTKCSTCSHLLLTITKWYTLHQLPLAIKYKPNMITTSPDSKCYLLSINMID